MTRIALIFSLLFIGINILPAQVVINEYSASNLNSFYDSFDRTEDWIEIYNAGSSTVNISGWYISDKESNPGKWEIPEGTFLPAGGFLTFWCSGRDKVVNGEYHTNFKLAQTTGNDFIVLANADEEILESYTMDLTLVEHSRCRITDGASEWRICTQPTPGTSNDAAPKFIGYTTTPELSLEAGFYEGSQVVGIINNLPNSTLHYTLDGTNPTTSSPIYSNAIQIDTTTVVKARVFSNDPTILPGKMTFRTYFIDETFSLAVFSVAADQVVSLANGEGALIPIGSLEYFNTNRELEATSFGSLNRHGQDSWVLPHRSLDWISRDEMGYSKAVNAPLFSYSDRDEYQKFMFRNSGDDNYPAINDAAHQGSAHIRDEYVQTLSQEGGMELDLRAVERVVLFLNGQYWGVYGMRERPVDHDYTDEYYDQGKYDIQYLSTWGTTEIEYGGQQALIDWVNFRDFVLNNDMSDSANYEVVTDSLNVLSLIDYMIVNLNVVASDWLNYNTGWWRGRNPDGDHKKWGYILWDLDATFDYYINYSGVPNTNPDADPCDLEVIGDYMDVFFGSGDPLDPFSCNTVQNGSSPYPPTDSIFALTINDDPYCCDTDWDDICQGIYDNYAANGADLGDGDVGRHEKIFLKLLEENETFRNLYYGRYADLMNTVYTCENMISTLDRMLDVIDPEMPRQIERWGGTYDGWKDNVEQLKDFINQRCELLDDGALECYDELNGPYSVTLLTAPDSVAEIDFNTLDIESFPWTGEYFGGMENRIKTKAFDEYEDEYFFSHWESTAGNIIADSLAKRTTISLTQADTLIAVYDFISSTVDIEQIHKVRVFPNPVKDQLSVQYRLPTSANVRLELYSLTGQLIEVFGDAGGLQGSGDHLVALDLERLGLSAGLYFLQVNIDGASKAFKISLIR